MISGNYEDGVRDTLKFLQDNHKIEMIDMSIEQFISLVATLSRRVTK